MPLSVKDVCVKCSKTVNQCHKNISCKVCNGYVHKKCTLLKPKQLKVLNPKEWICQNCSRPFDNSNNSNSDIEAEVYDLNQSPHVKNITDVDLEKYDKMIFNPLTLDCNFNNKNYNDIVNSVNCDMHECAYVTPAQFCSDIDASRGKCMMSALCIGWR